jgi:hypothetical protein
MTDIPSWAVRRAKVVCIMNSWDESARVDPAGLMVAPVAGEEYTIREVRVRYVSEHNAVAVGILLDEIRNPIAEGGSATGEEPAWWVGGFRPLKTQAAEREIEISGPRERADA